jgi:hypothetical protein
LVNSDEIYNKVLQKIELTSKRSIHYINIDKNLILTDPSYQKEIANNKRFPISQIIQVTPGRWMVYYQSWITKRPNILVAINEKYIDKDLKYTYHKYGLGVDIGQLTICNEKDYPDLDMNDHFEWAEKNLFCDSKKNYKKYKNGYTVVTGFGDGSYGYIIGKYDNKIVKIIVNFMI